MVRDTAKVKASMGMGMGMGKGMEDTLRQGRVQRQGSELPNSGSSMAAVLAVLRVHMVPSTRMALALAPPAQVLVSIMANPVKVLPVQGCMGPVMDMDMDMVQVKERLRTHRSR